jgi:predicted RNA binding protein YcfA (HicA-like mRNA interferase family)
METQKIAEGSHLQLMRNGVRYTWAFHDNEEIGPRMLSRIARTTGLTPSDL